MTRAPGDAPIAVRGWMFQGWAAVLLLGAVLHLLPVRMPVDTDSWREADMAAIARSYYRGESGFLWPRIEWRGAGPGFVESEFPLYPWSMAALHEAAGYDARHGRELSAAFSLLGLAAFLGICGRLLSPLGSLGAGLFFVLNPLTFDLSFSLQPDGLMLSAALGAVYAFMRWLDSGRPRWGVLAALSLATAILVKVVAVHLGLLLAAMVLRRDGLVAARWPRYWAFAAAALLPGAAWYAHAHSIYLEYGNSLGISNETHFIGLDFLSNPAFVRGILRNQLAYVWTPFGALLIAAGLALSGRGRAVDLAGAWLLAALAYIVAIARTSADAWAFYYHAVCVPPVAILFGVAAEAVVDRAARAFRARAAGRLLPAAGALGLLMLAPLTYADELRRLVRVLPVRSPLAACAGPFARSVPEGSLILASGGACADPDGYPVAYDASYFFYWMDRKGFTVCTHEQSLARIESIAARGARFFVAEKARLREAGPDFEPRLRTRFRVAGECDGAVLLALEPPSPGAAPGAGRSGAAAEGKE